METTPVIANSSLLNAITTPHKEINLQKVIQLGLLEEFKKTYQNAPLRRVIHLIVEFDKLPLFKWLVESKKIQLTSGLYLDPIYKGRLNFIKYLFNLGCPVTKWTTSIACSHCSEEDPLKIINFFYTKNCPFGVSAVNGILSTIRKNKVKVLNFLINNGCPMSKANMLQAVIFRDLEIIKLLFDAGCPFDKRQCLKSAISEYTPEFYTEVLNIFNPPASPKEETPVDFYENPPNSKNGIYKYLTSWLEPVDTGIGFSKNNQHWIQTQGFRRAFNGHGVFQNKATDVFAFHVFNSDSNDNDFETFPNFGQYDTYEKMLEGVVDRYAKLWNITN